MTLRARPNPRRVFRRLCLAFLLWLLGLSCARAAPWPAVDSDATPDPAVQWGALSNGLRYAILPNAEPKDRVSLRFVVAAGSLHERDDELGLAHFVEHMAFRGTRGHPNGSLTPALQRLGLDLGPDSAAFTTYDHTIYHLELPDTKETTLREALHVFREWASDVTFDASLIERERGVILSEKATRDTPEARSGLAHLQFLFPQSRHVQRPVIGTEPAIRRFTRDEFVAFYDAWYRPERMAVLAVGDIDAAMVARLIAAEFSDLSARAPPRDEPADLSPSSASNRDVGIFSDPGIVGCGLTFAHPLSVPATRDTHALRVRQLQRALAFAMFHNRVQRISHEDDSVLVAPTATTSWFFPDWQVASLTVSSKIDDWQKVAAEMEREHRRAFQFGFTARELEEARATFTTGYEQSVRTAATRPSPWLVGQLVGSILSGKVFTTPAAQQSDLAADLAAATLDDCLAEFRAAWTTGAPHVFVTANPSFRITRAQIASALNASRQTEAARRAESAAPTAFAYGDFGPPGRLVRDELIADLGVRLGEFANGVRCNFKSTLYEADTVEVHVRVGEGKLRQPKNQPGLDLLANAMLTAGGLGRHTAQELRDLLAGRALNVAFHVESDAFVFNGRCARRDLLQCLQIIAAYLTDAAYRPEAMRDVNAGFGSMYASLAATPGGPIAMRAVSMLLSGDSRFGIPPGEDLFARTLPELIDWLDPQLKHGAIELSLVGDVSWDEARPALASTFGALPLREPRAEPLGGANVKFADHKADVTIFGLDPKMKQCALAIFWPVPASDDIHEERRSVLLCHVLTERLRLHLREGLGATYSAAATFTRVSGFPVVNYFSLYAEVEAARAAQALQIIQREVAALAAKGPDADEFTRAQQPYLHSMNDSLRTNSYWGATVLADAQQRPFRLTAARDRAADIVAITRAEISDLARRSLIAKNAFTFATVPAVVRAPPAPPASN